MVPVQANWQLKAPLQYPLQTERLLLIINWVYGII
jgi:hypothetical protein